MLQKTGSKGSTSFQRMETDFNTLNAKGEVIMSTASIASATALPAQQVQEKGETQRTSHAATVRESRQQLNMQILQESARVSLRTGNESLSLLLRSAIDNIGGLFSSKASNDAIPGIVTNQDTSPEATAGRILDFSTAFFDSYARQHPREDPEKVATNFVATIRKGFERGFNEAKKILEGMSAFTGAVKDGVTNTWNLVQKGYDDFLANKLSGIKGA